MQEFSVLTLSNGIRCVHRRVKSPVANIALTINAGTRDEKPMQHGVAHLVEHLLFKGTHKRSAYQINNRLESTGGELNAFTTKEETVLHASCLKADFTRGMDLIVDMVFNSRFPDQEIAKEKDVIVDEINSYKDSPSELIYDDFEEQLFAKSTLGRNILGTARQLKKVTREDLIDYVNLNYNTDEIVFSASSALTHRQFQLKCEKILGEIPRREKCNNRIKPHATHFVQECNKRTHQKHTIIGGECYSLYDAERLPFSLLINILGGQSALSLLNSTLREKYALTYNIDAAYSPYSDSGAWSIYFSCEHEKHEQAMELVYKEIHKICDKKLSDRELRKAKRQFIGQMAISSDNNEIFMLGIAKSLLVFNTFDTNEELFAKVEGITSDEIIDVANQIFKSQNISTLIYK